MPVVDLEPRPHGPGRSVLFEPTALTTALPSGTLQRLKRTSRSSTSALRQTGERCEPSSGFQRTAHVCRRRGGGCSRRRVCSVAELRERSPASVAGHANEADSGHSSAADSLQRSNQCRVGQRRRQLLRRRCEGLCGTRCLSTSNGGCENNRQADRSERCTGTLVYLRIRSTVA